ncbi:hypothetical protein [Methanomassiliicoccus luminyensis]|jgi:hypothetical protein|uniref:hypothetical protein n=1 Tax=Methanomassiliicoccus luminyensis TaxID=1080712 RepID=UPI00037930A1|nr:hypothetical protein [Methanomassiliicoccus luminyensis]
MNQLEASVIEKKLLLDGVRFTMRDELAAIAAKIDKDLTTSLSQRFFRGMFYVSSPDEIATGVRDYSLMK